MRLSILLSKNWLERIHNTYLQGKTLDIDFFKHVKYVTPYSKSIDLQLEVPQTP